MEADMTVCISSPIDIDEGVMRAWTYGLSQHEALTLKLRESSTGFQGFVFRNQFKKFEVETTTRELYRKDIMDQYRAFEYLEHYFQNPLLLQHHTIIELAQAQQRQIVTYYWTLDDIFVKEILVTKKPVKSRKDLDDIAESTGLNLRRVTRQFENLKRLFVAIEESKSSWQCNIVSYLEDNFALPQPLSVRYAALLFIQAAKFSLASKKRIQRVPAESLEKSGMVIMACMNTEQDIFYNCVQ
jgi:hypothetical protein